MFSLYLVVGFLFGQVIVGQELISKCPEFFKYDTARNGDGVWYGEIILNSEYSLAGYWIEFELSNNAHVLGIKSTQPVITKDNKKYVFVTRANKIEPGKSTIIPIFVRYDSLDFPIPEIESIYLNGREVCPMQSPVPVGISSCPGIFTYDPDQPEASGKWYGTINLNLEYNLHGVYLEFHLNGKADLVGNINYRVRQADNQEIHYWAPFGAITTKDNRIYSIANSSFVLPYGNVLIVPFFVKYDVLSGIPQVNTVVINGRIICQGSFKELEPQIPLVFDTTNLAVPSIKFQTTEKPAISLYSAISTTEGIIVPDIPDFIEEDDDKSKGYQCGVQEITDKIIHGSTASIRQHPWHGAIFKKERYICGITLISRKHAISAAHCFYDTSRIRTSQNDLSVRFGIDNLNNRYSRDVQFGKISNVLTHPEYQYHTTRYDIAVVAFANELKITETVIPVCLWSGSYSQHEIENKTGVIVGFGQTESGEYSNILREAKILVVNSETCREAASQFYAIHLSVNSFCAGNISSVAEKAISPCFGDSGGGMFFKKPGTEIWEIRGIISTSQPTNDRKTCVPWVYAIFTDVIKFKDWIVDIMRQ